MFALLDTCVINSPSLKILSLLKITSFIFSLKNGGGGVTSLSVGLLMVGQVFSVSCEIVCLWVTTNCSSLSDISTRKVRIGIFMKFGTVNFNKVYTHAEFPVFWNFGRVFPDFSRDRSALIFKVIRRWHICVNVRRVLFSIYCSAPVSVKIGTDEPPVFAQSKAKSSCFLPPTFQLASGRPVLCDATPNVTSGCHASSWSFASAL
jgi:hypothetical protein